MTQSDRQSVLTLLEGMIVQQRAKCLKIARGLNPRMTEDDLMNPFDWPEVSDNPQFAWEDGLLAGLLSAHAAVIAQMHDEIAGREAHPSESEQA